MILMSVVLMGSVELGSTETFREDFLLIHVSLAPPSVIQMNPLACYHIICFFKAVKSGYPTVSVYAGGVAKDTGASDITWFVSVTSGAITLSSS